MLSKYTNEKLIEGSNFNVDYLVERIHLYKIVHSPEFFRRVFIVPGPEV